MTSDPAISQPVPTYFLQEASELLQEIDNELQTLRQDFSVQKMHSLMRAAHTLKGAAASVGLDAIKTTTHSLEDAFKALCVPDATLTSAVEGLIFEAYDCLQLLLSAQLAEAQIDESSILDRMAGVVTKLQDNLGNQFGQDGYLPTSTELGFDMTQSIFEMGVAQRLNDLETALKAPEPDALRVLLKSQAEVFFGLAESLSLPGFGEIAQTTLKALNQRPDQVIQIATAALGDYRSGQSSVLQGDRTQGGAPCPALKQLSTKHSPKKANRRYKTQSSNNRRTTSKPSWYRQLWRLLNRPIGGAQPPKVRASRPAIPHSPKSSTPPIPVSKVNDQTTVQALENIWETAAVSALPEVSTAATEPLSSLVEQFSTDLSGSSITSQEIKPSNPPVLPRNTTLRVSIDHLEQLNHTIGELLTQQNRQALYNERLTTAMQTLLNRLGQQQLQLHRLQRQTIQTSGTFHLKSFTPTEQQFDSLELDHYSELQLLVQASLDSMVQQMESAEAVELFVRQSSQTLERQQRLVNDLRETMLEARMQPLGNLLQRFHQVLTRLSAQHDKQVDLVIQGDDVLVDKVIADKLYDPLLHLVRNAFDHGIEKPEVRQQQGKTARAQIQLSASQAGRYLVIRVQDNGQGLNLEAIRQKAIENQLITNLEAQQLTSAQISDLIFEPDLSTAARINDLSGRGVGLDAVRAQMQILRGTVTVTHQSGQGTCFILKIPADLTIAKLLLCQAGEKLYALMTDTIEQILIPGSEQLTTRGDRKVLSLQFEDMMQLVPVIPLSEALTYNALLPAVHRRENNNAPERPIVLMRHKKRLVGLEIDQLQGEQELVIRSLGDMSETLTYVYGCSTLPDGRLSLVIDGVALALKILQKFSGQTSNTVKDDLSLSSDELSPTLRQSILVVDDSITVRNTLTQALQKAGYWVLQAKEGAEALRMLQQSDVAAILCDLEMPGMNGFEFLRARQKTPAIASIPTIMLTSRTGGKHRQLAQELGATSYLTKPYLTPQLLATLTDVLAQPAKTDLFDLSGRSHG